MVVMLHVAQKSRHSGIEGITTRHPGYAKSQRRRNKMEEPFGWANTVGDGSAPVSRHRAGAPPFHDDNGGLQSGEAAKTARGLTREAALGTARS